MTNLTFTWVETGKVVELTYTEAEQLLGQKALDEILDNENPDVIVETDEDNLEMSGPDNYMDDGDALASAGWGMDEDYGGGDML